MGNYDDYKRGRDLAWETLINSRVSSLPVELDRVAGCCGVSVISFERAVKAGYIYEDEAVGKMFAKTIDGIKTVFVNNTLENKGSIRFLIAKGIEQLMRPEFLQEICLCRQRCCLDLE